MAEKILWEKLYWSVEKPDKIAVVVTKANQPVFSGPPGQGKDTGGRLGIGANLILDKNESANGKTRIVKVVLRDPVPSGWYDDSTPETMPEWYDGEERFRPEFWFDNGAFVPANADQSKIRLIVEWDNATGSGTVVKA